MILLPTIKKGSEEWNKVSPKSKKKKSSLNTQLAKAVEKVGKLGSDWARAKNEAVAKNTNQNMGRLKTVNNMRQLLRKINPPSNKKYLFVF